MPTVPVKAAGWRMEPPVSVAVAPAHRKEETADAEPPDETERFPLREVLSVDAFLSRLRQLGA